MIESALDIRGVNGTGGVICGASSGGESMNVGGGRSSFCSTSVELLCFGGIVGVTLDLLAAVHGGGDSEVISGVSCCVGGGEGGSGWDLLEFCEGTGLGGLGNCLNGLLGGTGNGVSCGDRWLYVAYWGGGSVGVEGNWV